MCSASILRRKGSALVSVPVRVPSGRNVTAFRNNAQFSDESDGCIRCISGGEYRGGLYRSLPHDLRFSVKGFRQRWYLSKRNKLNSKISRRAFEGNQLSLRVRCSGCAFQLEVASSFRDMHLIALRFRSSTFPVAAHPRTETCPLGLSRV